MRQEGILIFSSAVVIYKFIISCTRSAVFLCQRVSLYRSQTCGSTTCFRWGPSKLMSEYRDLIPETLPVRQLLSRPTEEIQLYAVMRPRLGFQGGHATLYLTPGMSYRVHLASQALIMSDFGGKLHVPWVHFSCLQSSFVGVQLESAVSENSSCSSLEVIPFRECAGLRA